MMRPCLGNCGELVAGGSRRCTDCQRALWRSLPSRESRGYTRKWRTISRKVRRRNPLCALRLPGCTGLATAADHILPLSLGGTSTFANAQPACTACNNAKKALDRERSPQ